jgi:hypothetical protein
MNLRKIVISFAKEFLLALVFLSAAWINVGLDQNETFLRGFFLYVYSLLSNTFFFWILPFLIISFSMMILYFIGRFSGLAALILVFIGESFRYSLPGIVMILIGTTIVIFPPVRQSTNVSSKFLQN